MGEDFDPLTTDSGVKPISHKSILMIMSVLIAAGTLAGFIFGGLAWGIGVLFGGALSFANYFWLDRVTRAMFDQQAVATTGTLAVKYILRYAVIGAVLLLIFLTGAMPVSAVILGLAAFAFAVVIEGLKNIFSSSF